MKDKTADTQTLSDKIEKLKNDIREIDDKAIKELIRIMMDENRTVLKSKIMELENEIIYLKSHTWYNLEDEKSIKEQERKDIREAVQKILGSFKRHKERTSDLIHIDDVIEIIKSEMGRKLSNG